MTQGWSDSRPLPRHAAYASRGHESYKGWGEGLYDLRLRLRAALTRLAALATLSPAGRGKSSSQLRLELLRPQRLVVPVLVRHRHHAGRAVDRHVAEELQVVAERGHELLGR